MANKSPIKFDLNHVCMNVISTAKNGMVNEHTIFNFTQKHAIVSAKYQGGGVVKGYLIGRINKHALSFKYVQQHLDDQLNFGESTCRLERLDNGQIQMIEKFRWNDGEGENVFQELKT